MEGKPYISVDELPPRPDPVTGQPRPPRAPGFSKEDKPPKEADSGRDRSDRRKPSPPEGQGPVLEWFRASQRQAISTAVIGFVLVAIGITLMQGFDVTWMSAWWMWCIVATAACGIYLSSRVSSPAAGAEWLLEGKSWVRLYELVEIKAKVRSNAVHVDLKDRDGRKLQISSSDIQEDRDMWDLVYNGMLHSIVAGGAETNLLLHGSFDLPHPLKDAP